MRLSEVAKKQVVVVYPGRFQPFHKGHKAVYDHLSGEYDNVYVATSDKVDPPKSPFSFDEKKKMMELTGMDTSKVVLTKQPYIPNEITQNFDKENTILLIAVSEKDMAEDPRFSFNPKKDGSPSYFQDAKDGNFETMDKHGYIMTVPTFDFKVLGKQAKSATEIRSMFAKMDKATQKKLVTDLFGSYSPEVHKLMATKITESLMEADNFTADDINKLAVVKDLGIAKERALAMITANKGGRPMKIEKQRWFRGKVESANSINQLVKMLYDMLLAGEGLSVSGSKYTTGKNSYQRTFEGGWEDTLTQQTKLTPAVVKAVLQITEKFTADFNKYLKKNKVGQVKMGAALGSTAYHEVDDPDTEYGDIDLQMIAPEVEGMSGFQLQKYYNEHIDNFLNATKPAYYHDRGKPNQGHPIFKIGDDAYVQVDMLWTTEGLSQWDRYRKTPMRGIKGLITGNLYSTLGEVINMSIQTGVLMKIKDGEPVNYQRGRKPDKVVEITRNIEKFGLDILKYVYKAVNGSLKGLVVNDLLKQYPGVKTDDIQVADIAKTIKGLFQAFEDNNLYGQHVLKDYKNKTELQRTYLAHYLDKADKAGKGAKLDKAETPEELAKVDELRDKIAKGVKLVKQAFKENRETKNMSAQKLGIFTKGKRKLGLWEHDGKVVLVDQTTKQLQETKVSIRDTVDSLYDKGYVCESVDITTMKNAAGAIMRVMYDTVKKTTTVRDKEGGSHTYNAAGDKVISALQKKGFNQEEDDFGGMTLEPMDKDDGMAKPMQGFI